MKRIIDLIPNLDPLFEAVCEFVKKNSNEKGYLDTRNVNGENDNIYGLEYLNFDDGEIKESRVWALATEVDKNGKDDLSVYIDDYRSCPSDENLEDRTSPQWVSFRWNDILLYVQTLVNIAEAIEEYEKK